MALKISQLPAAGALTGAEIIPMVQGGLTVKTPVTSLVMTGVENTYTKNGDQNIYSLGPSMMRFGTWSDPAVLSGGMYTLLGELCMFYQSHNVALTAAGDFAGRDETDACWLICYTESGLVKYYYAVSAAAGVVPTWVLQKVMTMSSGSMLLSGSLGATGVIAGSQLTSSVATGTAPLVVTSTTPVAHLSIGGTAAGLASATTSISVSTAAAPTAGQALVATGPTAATWQGVMTQAAADARYGSSFFSVSASVGSNALTLGLAACKLDFRNATLGTGTPVNASITAPLSITVPSTATLGTINATAAQLIILVAYNAGTPVLCVTNLAGGLQLDETNLISPTTISTGATADYVIYSASAVAASSPYRVVGFVNVTEATAGTWATAPSLVQGAGGQAMATMQSLGYGQTWQNVTGSRVLGATYYNTTGRLISLSIQLNWSTSSGSNYAIYENGSVVQQIGANGTYSNPSFSVVVPPGFSYSCTLTSGNAGTISYWFELR